MYSWANPWGALEIPNHWFGREDQVGPSPSRELLPRWQLEWFCALLVAAPNPQSHVSNDKRTAVQHPHRRQSSQYAPKHWACCTSQSPNVLLVAERAPSACSHVTEQASAQIALDNALGPDRNGSRHKVLPSLHSPISYGGRASPNIWINCLRCILYIRFSTATEH